MEFAGDVLMVREDETGFLSSLARGGDRILYALCATDIRFYLEAHRLIVAGNQPARVAPSLTVVPFRPRVAVA